MCPCPKRQDCVFMERPGEESFQHLSFLSLILSPQQLEFPPSVSPQNPEANFQGYVRLRTTLKHALRLHIV